MNITLSKRNDKDRIYAVKTTVDVHK